MERNANYTLVGFVALVLMIGMVAFIVWLARVQFVKENDFYDIVFVGPVTGLPEGGDVQFNGIKVGEVTDLSLDAQDPNRVIARARVESSVPVRADSYATLEPLGITGVSFVQITAGTPTEPLLKDITPPNRTPVIRTQPSMLADLLQGGGTVLERAVEALDRVTDVLSEQNIANFSGALEDISILTTAMRDNVGLFKDARAALGSVERTANEVIELVNRTQELVDREGAPALSELRGAAEEIRAAAAETRATVSALRGPTTDFATNTLPQAQAAIVSLQGAAEALERLANEIEQDPRALISKPPAREIEVAP